MRGGQEAAVLMDMARDEALTGTGEDNVRLPRREYQALLDLIDKMEELLQFQDRIETPTRTERIWELYLSEVRDAFPADACALFLVDPETMAFRLESSWPESAAGSCRFELDRHVESGMFSSILARRRLALLPPQACGTSGTLIVLPLTTVKRTLGAVMVLTGEAPDQLPQEGLKLLDLLTKQYTLVLDNTMLYRRLMEEQESLIRANREIQLLSRTDSLTGVYNRNHLNERLPHEIKRAVRYGKNLSLILTDIDHFKKVNDTYGHPTGDAVLKHFTRLMRSMIRTDLDWIARYGGEEFLIVLPETERPGAAVLAERLRTAIAGQDIVVSGVTVRITASFGVTGISAEEELREPSAPAFFSRTDQLLYQAKRGGRNRVVIGAFTGGRDAE